jgi:hypothetical protein
VWAWWAMCDPLDKHSLLNHNAPTRSSTPTTIVRQVEGKPVEAHTSAPANVGVSPKDAECSESGLAWLLTGKGEAPRGMLVYDVELLRFKPPPPRPVAPPPTE